VVVQVDPATVAVAVALVDIENQPCQLDQELLLLQ
jgi:hypothetical protein